MQDDANPIIPTLKKVPWNKGKLIGAKPPLRQKHVWAIRTMLQVEPSKRDLAMFNLAIDSKLRGCDVLALRVEELRPQRGLGSDQLALVPGRAGWGFQRAGFVV